MRRLFRANETFRGRIRAELILTPVKAVPPAPLLAVCVASAEPSQQSHSLSRQRDLTESPLILCNCVRGLEAAVGEQKM